MLFYKFVQIVFGLPFRLFFPARVFGRKNLVKGGAVLVCNHQSSLDVVLLAGYIFKYQVFLGKKELFEKPFLKGLLKTIKAIPITREKPELSSIRQSLKVLKEDKYLTVFPQGTRIEGGKMENLKGGVLLFSQKAQKPIVPIWVEKKVKVFRFNKIHIGKPIYADTSEGLSHAQQGEKMLEQLEEFYSQFYKN